MEPPFTIFVTTDPKQQKKPTYSECLKTTQICAFNSFSFLDKFTRFYWDKFVYVCVLGHRMSATEQVQQQWQQNHLDSPDISNWAAT